MKPDPERTRLANVLRPSDPAWPAGLDDLAEPPRALAIRGVLPAAGRVTVAVVGTRRADDEGMGLARDFGAELARAGVVVASGGARGIDAAAHLGALEAGGTTVAVLATGVDRPYPPEHGPLFHRIARSGALLSEQLAPVTPHPGRFLARNRLLAAMASVVVVVQAPARSGALHTASVARRLGRRVLVVPASPWDPRGSGCLALLRAGAGVCTSARDVLSVCACGARAEESAAARSPENAKVLAGLDDEQRRVVSALGRRTRSLDEVIRISGLGAARALEVLATLELGGRVVEGATGGYHLAPSGDP